MSEVKRRGGHRSIVKSLISEIRDILSSPNVDNMKLKCKLKSLINQKEKIEALDEKIQDTMEEKILYPDMQEAFKVTSEIEEIVCIVEEKFKADLATTSNGSEVTRSVMKLPTLHLPVFTGDPIDWMHFWDTFRAAVHNRKDITGASKFSYLIGQLQGEARQLLEGFTTTDSHYDEAVKLMEETYGKPSKIVQAHIGALLDLNVPKPSAKDLSKFRASYECHLRGLSTLQVDIDAAGVVLAIILIRKLPAKIKDNISRASNVDLWTLSNFREAINREIELLQVAEQEDKITKQPNEAWKPNISKNEEFSKLKSTASTFNVTSGAFKKVCKFCSSANHKEVDCAKYCSVILRRERAKELNLCYNCLYDNHQVRDCRSNYYCKYCHGWHHHLLCLKEIKEKKSHEKTTTATTVSSIRQNGCKVASVALPTAMLPVKIKGKQLTCIRALFDQGSQKTFILGDTVQKLQLGIKGKIKLRIDGFQSEGKVQEYNVVIFDVRTRLGIIEVEAVVVKSLPARVEVPGLTKTIHMLKTNGIYLADPSVIGDVVTDVGVLIGADQFYKFVSGQQTVGNIHLINSSLGFMISGPIQTNDIGDRSVSSQIVTVLKVNVSDSTDEEIQRIWSFDSIGINASIGDGDNLKRDFLHQVEYSDGRYTVKLPWKENHSFLPTNYGMARGRLIGTLKRLRKSPKQIDIYHKIIQDQLEKGFIEEIDSSKKLNEYSKIHFLSHHGILKRDSVTTPLRIVYDCSAGNPSLNQCLHTGPSLIQELGKILLRFRLGKYACVSDIAKAYLMIGLHEQDRDSTRFLWVEDPHQENSKIKVYRFKVVLFGATCSQYLLNATILHHLKLHDSSVARSLSRNIYVDNLQGMFQSENDATQFYDDGKTIMQKAGFMMREWMTNAPSLQRKIEANGDNATLKNGKYVKVLGMQWIVASDTIGFPKNDFHIATEEFTKRNIVSKAAKVFDPLGILAPITIASRIFIQDVWKEKYDWDQVITNIQLIERWGKIASNIEQALQFEIPRSMHISGNLQLHAFSDASCRAYGAIVYISNKEKIQFVISKAKVAPLNLLTIPKLELTAAMISARLVSYVVNAYSQELKFDSIYLWIDSQITLHWITGDKQLTSFVQNKVNNIRMLCGEANFRYVPSQDNPADFLTKGMDTEHFKNSPLWNHGPDWLLKNDEEWPLNEWSNVKSTEISDSYIVSNIVDVKLKYFIDMERYGTLEKLLHISVLVFRFVKLMKKRTTKKCTIVDHKISVAELQEAEMILIKQVQNNDYDQEINYLRCRNGRVPNLVIQLNLYLIEDVIKCRGRLQHADIASSAKDPILLPSKCLLTELIILNAHSKVHHGGTTLVMSYIRQRFWVPCLRQRVKMLLRSCVTCRKIHGNHYTIPEPPPLPMKRVQESRPFAVTGVDYTGALLVRDNKTEQKVYISLFTCAVTRAIHLELVTDNSSESFLRAFRRFVSRRSVPKLMMSDNSTTFISSAKFLRELQRDEKVRSALTNNYCEWKFIPSRAPWFGGYWERLIALTKNSIKKVLGRAFVTMDEMRTLIVEVEGILNDRPLTYVSDSIDDGESLCPSQLLYGHKIGGLPEPIDIDILDEDFITPSLLSARQKRCERLRKQFWNRWRGDYILSLRERHSEKLKKLPTNQQQGYIKPNDVVLIHDDGPRIGWKMGRILKIFTSEDGCVRSALLRTTNAEITRPIKRLYPLEVGLRLGDHEEAQSKGSTEGIDSMPSRIVPRRAAAERASKAIQEQLN